MPKPRFTLRWLMVAVAVVGAGFAALKWKWAMDARAERYSRLALFHAANMGGPDGGSIRSMARTNAKLAVWIDRRNLYHREMADKWFRAARYPWLPVAPDPPRPELE